MNLLISPTIGSMVPLRDAKENLLTHRDTHLQLGQRYTQVSHSIPNNAPIPHVNLQRDKWLPGQGTTRCFVVPTAQQKICGNNIRRVDKLLWLKGKGTRGWKSRRSWRKQMNWRRKGNCKAKLRAHLALAS